MYRNTPMTLDAALDLVIELGHALSAKDADGKAIAGTAKVGLRPNGDGFDACIPIELLHRLIARPDVERERRIAKWERLFSDNTCIPSGILDHEGGRPDGV
ncbi:MAG: hypothetical protein JWN86_3607 [Planctomycetota bacterium]|nr:hypothetical protein [Planctomycetota bacterium]